MTDLPVSNLPGVGISQVFQDLSLKDIVPCAVALSRENFEGEKFTRVVFPALRYHL